MATTSHHDQPDDYVRLATLGAPNGLAGLIKLALHTDNPHERLAVGKELQVEGESSVLTVASLLQRPQGLFISFCGYESREAAETLRGKTLLGDPEFSDDAWYAFELVGLRARTEDGQMLGEVVDFQLGSAQDLLTVKTQDGKRHLVPFAEPIVVQVDTDTGEIILDPPAGLLNEAEQL